MMKKSFRNILFEIMFEDETKAGKIFDILLFFVILFSVAVVMLESVAPIRMKYGKFMTISEWVVTIIFSLEYLTRIYIVKRPKKYILSFYGIVDLLAVIPTYLALIFAGTQSLMVIRTLRLLRVFRIMKLSRYTSAGNIILNALKASRAKISVFIFAVIMVVIIIGTVMYLIEGEASGFVSIPKGIYWAIVTLTTVGYGDIAPVTIFGQFIAGFVMILGYAIIAVPTGIVAVEIVNAKKKKITTRVCPECLKEGHDPDAEFCKYCGKELNEK